MNTCLFCYLYTACSPLKIFYVFFLNIALMSLVQDNWGYVKQIRELKKQQLEWIIATSMD